MTKQKRLIFPSDLPNAKRFLPEDTIRRKVKEIFAGIYPKDLISEMPNEKYSPIIIGYEHGDDLSDLPTTKEIFIKIRKANSTKKIKVAFEILPPVQLQHIKEFLDFEKEFKDKGTVGGSAPGSKAREKQNMDDHRSNLEKNHSENLALWLLENDFSVIPIEHNDVIKWISEDEDVISRRDILFEKDGKKENLIIHRHMTQEVLRFMLTAVRRDRHGLYVLAHERPDIISVGCFHALKYDLLLNRTGQRSIYSLNDKITWDAIIELWEYAHFLSSIA